jgi:hypothetical protein
MILSVYGCEKRSMSQHPAKIDAGQAAELEHDAESALDTHAGLSNSGWRPLHADETYNGKRLEDWSQAWMQWLLTQNSCDDPTYDKDGSACTLYQKRDAEVFFLATGDAGTVRPNCSLPVGSAVIVPLAPEWADNGGLPDDDKQTDQELQRFVADMVASTVDLSLRVDGQDIDQSELKILAPQRYSYVAPQSPNWFSCNGYLPTEGEVSPAYFGGAFAILPPPEAGEHELVYGGTTYVDGMKLVNEVRVTLTVQ